MKHYTILSLVLILLLAVVGNIAAQDEADNLVVVAGTLSLEGDVITLTDDEGNIYVIAPAGDFFNPSKFEDGDEVELVGYELPDGETIQALSVEVPSDDDGDTDDDEGDDEDDGDEVADSDEGDDDDENAIFCSEDDEFLHPVGSALADTFEDAGVTYDDIMGVFCEDHLGFGEIARALLMAEIAIENGDLTEDDILLILETRAEGGDWKDLLDEYDIHPSDLAPGRIMGNIPEDAGPPEGVGAPEDVGPLDGAGPPDNLGPPSDVGPPNDVGPPDDAGPPAGRDNRRSIG